MFNQEQAIAAWRRQMQAAGIKTPATLDELESHLRDDLEQQMKAGLGAQQAFEAAAGRMGRPEALKAEFAETRRTPKTLGKIMGWTSAALMLFIMLLSSLTFYFMEVSPGDQIVACTAVAFILAGACVWRRGARFLPVISDPFKRNLTGWGIIFFGAGSSTFLIQCVMPAFQRTIDGMLPPVALWLMVPTAWFFYLGLGLMLTGEESERRRLAVN